jgi:hypothetical protein
MTLRMSEEATLLLIDDGDGWRFSQWNAVADDRRLPDPPPAAMAQRFPEAEAARLFFRLMLLESQRERATFSAGSPRADAAKRDALSDKH